MPESAELAQVQAMIDELERNDRAFLRPWMLAHYDESGDPPRMVSDLPKWMRDAK
jgi:hypothetical protein